MTRTHILSLLFFICAVTIYSIFEWYQTGEDESGKNDYSMNPDFVAELLNSKAFAQSGKLSYKIDALKMEHYSELAVTYFEMPKYTLFPKSEGAPWEISAKEATLFGTNRVQLEEDVLLVATDQDSIIKEIHGTYLELDLSTNIISSEQDIELKGADFVMYGAGLIVDLNTKQITLTKHDKTNYFKKAQ